MDGKERVRGFIPRNPILIMGIVMVVLTLREKNKFHQVMGGTEEETTKKQLT